MDEHKERPQVKRDSEVTVVVAENLVTRDELHKALDATIDLMAKVSPAGCPGCGLNGFDFRFLRGDPEFNKGLERIPNIEAGFLSRG